MNSTSSQWLLLACALSAWLVVPVPIFAAPVLAYLALWILVARTREPLRARPLRIATLVASIAAALLLIGRTPEILKTEGLEDLDVVLADRFRLSDLPAIAPPVAHTDRPNLHYVHAPGARSVALSFEGSDRDIPLADLGHGLFRAEIDPRVHGPLSERVRILVDGRAHERELALIEPSAHPRWIASNGKRACTVSTETDELFLIGTEISRVPTNDRPTDCAVLDRGAVVAHESGTLLLTGTSSDATIDLGAPLLHLAVRDRIAVTRGEPRPAIVILTRAPAIEREIELPFAPDWIAFDREGAILVSSAPGRSIHRFADARESARLFLGRPVVTMAIDPDGERLYAAITDYRPEDDAGPNHHLEDQIVELDARSLRILRRIPTAPHASPYAFAVSRDRIAVAYVGSDEVIRYDRTTFEELDRFEIDRPTGVAELPFDPDPIIASAPNARIGAIVFDTPDPLLLAGERAFYEATRAGPSCQSCHLHGGSDHSLHDIGHGDARFTLDARGKAGTAPYLRGASYPSLAALEAFTTYVLGGYDEALPNRAAALEAWVSSLPRSPPRPPPDPATLRAGTDAFVKAGCDFCHRFPAFTDLAQYPEGFLFPERKGELHLLDTPSLIGVADSAPYLYDGRAKTLEAVLFDHNRSRRHGDAAALSGEERDALLRFLRSL